ncbi:SpaA isopeptide-forming pilin-related protein [Methanolapillus millepedarum]|uniref:SpaA-like prealbumin fold domain-containing protein n=1 Tax=Methanolapillus millepedarum TaxID=3028296 RepID=A0AA96V3J8_9EURY|nr:hypothetical protein MsAc7_15110 [Methanosarcinaceae archaeon Ac7]
MKILEKGVSLFFILILLLTPAAAASVQIVVDGHNTGITTTACLEQGPGTQNPMAIGGYDLNGPVKSGNVTVTDNGAPGSNKNINLTDLIEINKSVSGPVSGEYTVNLTVDVAPAKFTYNDKPMDFIIVYDVTSSMKKSATTSVDSVPFDETRLKHAQDGIIKQAQVIWDSSPGSTITIIPYARDAFVPIEGGGLQFNASLMYSPMTAGTPLTTFVTNTVSGNVYGYRSFIYNDDTYEKQSTLVNIQDTLSNLTNYNAQDTFTVLTQYNYYKIQKPADSAELDKFKESVFKLPMAEDTNTQSGLQAAYDLLSDSTKFPSPHQENRVVLLITDGDANRHYMTGDPIWPDPGTGLDVPANYNSYMNGKRVLNPDDYNSAANLNVTGWLPQAASPEDIPYAHQACEDTADYIKDVLKGKAVVYVVGIGMKEINGTTNVRDSFKNVSTNDYVYFVPQVAPEGAVEDAIANAVFDALNCYAPYDNFTINDAINTQNFEFVPGSLEIKYSNGNGNPLTTFSNYQPGSDVNFADGKISVNMGKAPYPEGTGTSSTPVQYVISYKITAKPGVEGDHLHLGHDNMSYVSYAAPHHLSPNSKGNIVYYPNQGAPKTVFGYIPFNTPVVVLNALAIRKEVSTDNSTWVKHVNLPKTGGQVYYKITVTNGLLTSATLDRVNDRFGVNDSTAIYIDKTNSNLLENSSVSKVVPSYSGGILTLNAGETATFYYNKTYNSTAGTYENMVVVRQFDIYPVSDYDTGSGKLRASIAGVTVPKPDGGNNSSGGSGNVTPPSNTTVAAEGFESSGPGAELILEKTDSTNASKKLSATFEIRDQNGHSFSPKMIYKTNQSGHTERIYLTHGTTYMIYETESPTGYKPVDSGIKVTVNEDLTIQPVDGYELTKNGDVYTLTIPNDPATGACKVFHWWGLYALLALLLIVQSVYLVKKFRPGPKIETAGIDNKWWVILLIMIFATLVSALWFYQHYCHLSDWWILLPTVLTLIQVPVIYLYNKYFPKLKM